MAIDGLSKPIKPYIVEPKNPKTYRNWAIGFAIGGFVVGAVATLAFSNYYAGENAFIKSLSGTLGGRVLIGTTIPATAVLGIISGIFKTKYRHPYSKKEKYYTDLVENFENKHQRPFKISCIDEERKSYISKCELMLQDNYKNKDGNNIVAYTKERTTDQLFPASDSKKQMKRVHEFAANLGFLLYLNDRKNQLPQNQQ